MEQFFTQHSTLGIAFIVSCTGAFIALVVFASAL